jgi:hypothetical protein
MAGNVTILVATPTTSCVWSADCALLLLLLVMLLMSISCCWWWARALLLLKALPHLP